MGQGSTWGPAPLSQGGDANGRSSVPGGAVVGLLLVSGVALTQSGGEEVLRPVWARDVGAVVLADSVSLTGPIPGSLYRQIPQHGAVDTAIATGLQSPFPATCLPPTTC